MEPKPSTRRQYDRQRAAKTPPHASIKFVRMAAKLTIDETLERIRQETGVTYTRGAISAVENGHRGASAELVEALEIAYGLPAGSIDTQYQPRMSPE